MNKLPVTFPPPPDEVHLVSVKSKCNVKVYLENISQVHICIKSQQIPFFLEHRQKAHSFIVNETLNFCGRQLIVQSVTRGRSRKTFIIFSVLKKHFQSGGQIVPDLLLAKQLQWAKGRLVRLKDLTLPEFSFLWIAPTTFTYQGPISLETLIDLFRDFEKLKSDGDNIDSNSVSKFLRQFSKTKSIKFPVLMKCLRSVLSGLEDGPPVGEMVQLLGKEQTLRRINFAIECLSKESDSMSQKKL